MTDLVNQFFSLHGRTGRAAYSVSTVLIFAVFLGLTRLLLHPDSYLGEQGVWAFLAMMPLLAWSWTALAVKRLRSIGWPLMLGSTFILAPIIGFMIFLFDPSGYLLSGYHSGTGMLNIVLWVTLCFEAEQKPTR